MSREEKLQSIKAHLKKLKCASGTELAQKFSLSLRRLRDYLRAIDCLTSYSHRRSFYTLRETAHFDERRIWRCPRKEALFSDLDSLNALVEWHVRNSSTGLTCRALSAITRVRVEPHIRRISTEKGLIRQKFDGEYVYFSQANEKIYLRQLPQRRRISSKAGPGLETAIEGDVAGLQRDLQVALVLLNHPAGSPPSIVSMLREMGHRVTIEDLADFFKRYDIKKNDDTLPLTQLKFLGAAAKAQAALRSKGCSVADSCIVLDPDADSCPQCGSPLSVVKTTELREIFSVRFGKFWIKERIKACGSCDDQRTWHSKVPALVAPPKHVFAYDVMVFAGEQKFLFSKTLKTIRQILLADHGLLVSTSILSLYVQEFCCRFECLHYAKLAKLGRWIKKRQLGYMLHVDCTSEQKSDTVFVCYDRTSEIALISEKIPSERFPFLVPILKKVRKRLGDPISTMSDLGMSILKALEKVFPNVERRICHFHFIRDVGKDIVGSSYEVVRIRLNESKINAELNAIERDVLSVTSAFRRSTESVMKGEGPLLRRCTRRQYAEVEPLLALSFIRSCRKVRSSTGFGYPFDLPWVRYAEELCRQAVEVHACLEVLQERRITPVLLLKIGSVLSPLLPGGALRKELDPVVHQCLIREKQFAELRCVMRLWRPSIRGAPLSGKYGVSSRSEIVEFNQDLRQYRQRLRRSVSSSGQIFRNEGYRVILGHIEKYWGSLLLHPSLWRALQCQVVDSTNNVAESGHRDGKHSLRKVSGRPRIDREFSDYGAYLPVISNLNNRKYVEWVLGEYENLAFEFAQLDNTEVAHYRERFLEAKHGPMYQAVRSISGTTLI